MAEAAGSSRSCEGYVALVTGAASGIGRATALAFARHGARAVACLDLHGGYNEETAHALTEMGVEAIALTVDLGDVDQIAGAYGQMHQAFGRLDAACHIGGFSWRGDVLDVTPEQWDRVMAVNLKGTFFASQQALRIMYPQGSGAIVNMSADAAFFPVEGFSVQAAGKGGIAAMSRVLGTESARRGVRVNCVSPGVTKSEYQGVGRPDQPQLRDPIATAEDRADTAGQTAGQRWLTPAEVAETYVFLSSPLSSAINGQLIFANAGGYFALRL